MAAYNGEGMFITYLIYLRYIVAMHATHTSWYIYIGKLLWKLCNSFCLTYLKGEECVCWLCDKRMHKDAYENSVRRWFSSIIIEIWLKNISSFVYKKYIVIEDLSYKKRVTSPKSTEDLKV